MKTWWRVLTGVTAAAVIAVLSSCGSSQPSAAPPPVNPTPPPPSMPSAPALLVGAGDIAGCGDPGSAATAKLLDALPSAQVFTAGDNAYPSGTLQQFTDCFDATWGRHKSRMWPTPGNHDYETAGATGYYAYFGGAAGPMGLGYWRQTLGAWTIFGLNSNIDAGAASAQVQWLRTELSTNPTACTLAIWHHPLFTSGPNGDNRFMLDVWKTLYEFNADVIVNGHDHLFERFAPQDPDGRVDTARGITQFTVGTGGTSNLYAIANLKPNSQRIITGAVGVLKLTLLDRSYSWEFVPADPTASVDVCTATCH
jgi:hypothetical protein